MNQEKIKEIENNLKELGLIDNEDTVITTEKGDYWEKFLFINSQVRGYYYFTEKAIVFIGGFASSTQWAVQYKNIKKIEKCSIGPFLPFGVRIESYDEKKDKKIKYKLSLQKRENWIKFIEDKMK